MQDSVDILMIFSRYFQPLDIYEISFSFYLSTSIINQTWLEF